MVETTIGDAFNLKSGKQLSKSKMIPGEHPVFGGNGISGYHNEYMFKPPKIVIGRVGAYCGNVQTTKPYSWITDNALYIDEKLHQYDDSYLEYLLRSLDLKQYSSQSGQPLISQGRIKDVKIPLPSLSEQKAIVARLDRAQRLIDIDREMLAKYDELIQSVFLEMFGDPVSNEKGWEKHELGDLISDSRNGLYVKKDNYSEDDGVKMIHMSDAFYGYAKTDESKRVLISDAELNKYKVDSGDLLIARRSLNIEGAAKPCMIPDEIEDVVFESSLIKVTPDSTRLLPIFLYHFLSNDRARNEYLNKYITVSTISGINQSNLKKVEVLVPPLAEQMRFKSTVKQIEKEIVDLKNCSKKSEELFSSMVQGVFG